MNVYNTVQLTTILVFTYGFTNRIFVLTKNAVYL